MRLGQRNFEAIEVFNYKQPIRRFRVTRVGVAKIEAYRSQNNQSCLCHLPYNFSRNHLVFAYLIPALIGLLQVEYQNKSVSPFDTHPINMWVFFAATSIYCLGLSFKMEVQIHQPNYSKCINHVILSSGALSSVSLASIFLPRLFGWFCLGSWTLLSIILARDFIQLIFEILKKKVMEYISLARDKFNSFRASHAEDTTLAWVQRTN